MIFSWDVLQKSPYTTSRPMLRSPPELIHNKAIPVSCPHRGRPASDASLPARYAIWVKDLPKEILIRARALIAQPFASSTGPSVRFFSLNQAISMAGPEMSSIMPIIASGISQIFNPRMPLTMEARTPPIAPSASPIAAKIPANLPTSKGCLGAGEAEALLPLPA